jgi:4-hydroxy-tetrahydrodipicolinate synthase
VLKGKLDAAMKIYWHLAPAQTAALQQLGPKHAVGGGDIGMNHWPLAKYATWCVGGNGGLVRQPAMRLQAAHMRARKAALRAIGIEPREPDDEFFVGRVNYARGVRPTADLRASVAAG